LGGTASVGGFAGAFFVPGSPSGPVTWFFNSNGNTLLPSNGANSVWGNGGLGGTTTIFGNGASASGFGAV
jgi:hypothetical protein